MLNQQHQKANNGDDGKTLNAKGTTKETAAQKNMPKYETEAEAVLGDEDRLGPEHERLEPRPKIKGSKVKLWKQDPSTSLQIGSRLVFLPNEVAAGPSDAQIVIVPASGSRGAQPDKNNNFIFKENQIEFEMVHTYSVVRMVINMYERFLRTIKGEDFTLKWAWDSPSSMAVYHRAGVDENAYYSREDKAMKFFYYKVDNKTFYTCQSFDVVGHETGHAVLDALHPDWLLSDLAQTGALHESFADFTVILALLSQLDVCDTLMAQTKGNLRCPNFMDSIAEQFGETVMRKKALRNANNHVSLGEVSEEVHDLSNVFTGAMYDILATLLEDFLNPKIQDPAETLFRLGKTMREMVMCGYLNAPEKDPTFKDVAEQMLAFCDRDKWEASWKEHVRQQFVERKILGEGRDTRVLRMTPESFKKCGGNMNKMWMHPAVHKNAPAHIQHKPAAAAKPVTQKAHH
eukprot:TRINITY_DN2345_c0_g1_i1.p1 TRINITY_DN2345_c0_g1~~TRINITY_DN2345_c0_g1_i1.p1  ORF type:complete len:459 (+),score=137.25 TRINITY_DN2345_c0_g1_i1:75-1451(+)